MTMETKPVKMKNISRYVSRWQIELKRFTASILTELAVFVTGSDSVSQG